MNVRLLVGLVALALNSCTPGPVPRPTSCPALLNAYVEGRGSQYTGQLVELGLVATAFEVDGEQVQWYATSPAVGPPAVVFRCSTPPPGDNSRSVVVRGVVAGAHHDGIVRAPRVAFWIEVDQCRVR